VIDHGERNEQATLDLDDSTQEANIFKHIVQPSIDPDNYKPPAVASVLGADAHAISEHDTAAD
jgi:hypothetical protein